ncbi:MAG: hypothetical protein OHK0028_19460 [Deltaproteobacteria bacterium]
MRFPVTILRTLPAAALLALSTVPAAHAGTIPVADLPAGYSVPQGDVVFRFTIPIDEIRPEGWTERQRGEIAYHREQMRKRDEIFLLIRCTVDAIGGRKENEGLAVDVAQAVAHRLREAGVPPDRILLLPGEEDPRSLGEAHIESTGRFRQVEITGVLGGGWLRRRPAPEVKQEVALPRPVEIRLLEPAGGTTDRANHMLRGTTDPSIRVVSVTIGQEARTATVLEGTFEVPVSLRPGENAIVVTGLDPFGRAVRAERTVRYVPPHPTIDILFPAEGSVTDISRTPVVSVRGAVRSGTAIREVYLIQNDIPRKIRIRENGSFEQPAILMTGEDRFQVEALDAAGQAGTSAVRTARIRGVADRPLMAILHWDEDDVDIDLHVTDRRGNRTWFDAPNSSEAPGAIPEGRLWIDNREGFGPEVFSLEEDVPGEYTVSAEYYRGKKPCRVFLTLVLFAGTPSRKLVRIYGPVTLSPREPSATFLRVSLPSGTVRELRNTPSERERPS